MTNREWLESLSNEELSSFLCDLVDNGCKIMCEEWCGCNGFSTNIECEKKVVEWLNKQNKK